MVKTNLLNGLTGALGLYSGVKGLFDSASLARKQKRLLADAKAEESAWFKRNYYGNYLENSMAKAALKRVENTLHRQNAQNRAYARVNGATPELTRARNAQGLRSMENLMTNMATQSDTRRENIYAQHMQNKNAFRNRELAMLQYEEQRAGNSMLGGAQLVKNALLGMNWGKQKSDNIKDEGVYGETKEQYPVWDWG